MKKLLWVLLVLTLLALPAMALAEGTIIDGTSFFSWEALGTFSGAVALTVFVVQVLKLPLDKVWHIPTRYIVYGVSVMVLLLAQAFIPGRGGITWDSGLLCVFNALLVSLSAMSLYTQLIQEVEADKVIQQIIDEDIAISVPIEHDEAEHPPDPITGRTDNL